MASGDASRDDNKTTVQFIERMNLLLNSEENADISIRAQGKVFKAHKVVLSTGSSVLKSLLMKNKELVENNVMPDALELILKYIYTGSIDFPDLESARRVLVGAKKYELIGLIPECRNYISTNLSAQNVCSVFGHVKKMNGEDLILEQCIKIFCDKTSEVLKSEAFLESEELVISTLLDQEQLNLPSEAILIKAVIKWGDAKINRIATKEDRRAIFKFALPKMRLLTLKPEELTEVADLLNVFTAAELHSILTNVLYPLPQNICINRENRGTNKSEWEDERVGECEGERVGECEGERVGECEGEWVCECEGECECESEDE